ncbi:MAG TPA: DsbA family oxidoreductase, partial [Xanthobacteraceae bacterium]
MSATQSSPIQMPIDVVSDVVCPWCFIGKRRLEKALALRPDIAAEVRWRPYFLNDWIPREGIDRRTYLETKFGSAERYAAIAERVAAAARSEGLDYALDKIARQPNTLDCHRLILWARNTSDAGRMKQRLMELYFSAGADLTDVEVLVGAAVDCGMDGEVV